MNKSKLDVLPWTAYNHISRLQQLLYLLCLYDPQCPHPHSEKSGKKKRDEQRYRHLYMVVIFFFTISDDYLRLGFLVDHCEVISSDVIGEKPEVAICFILDCFPAYAWLQGIWKNLPGSNWCS